MANTDKWRIRLKERAKSKSITNEDIAHHFSITPGQVSHWFTGRRDIWLTEYIELCRFILEDPAKMLSGESMPQPVSNAQIAEQNTRIMSLLEMMQAKPETLPDHKKMIRKIKKSTKTRTKAPAKTRARSGT